MYTYRLSRSQKACWIEFVRALSSHGVHAPVGSESGFPNRISIGTSTDSFIVVYTKDEWVILKSLEGVSHLIGVPVVTVDIPYHHHQQRKRLFVCDSSISQRLYIYRIENDKFPVARRRKDTIVHIQRNQKTKRKRHTPRFSVQLARNSRMTTEMEEWYAMAVQIGSGIREEQQHQHSQRDPTSSMSQAHMVSLHSTTSQPQKNPQQHALPKLSTLDVTTLRTGPSSSSFFGTGLDPLYESLFIMGGSIPTRSESSSSSSSLARGGSSSLSSRPLPVATTGTNGITALTTKDHRHENPPSQPSTPPTTNIHTRRQPQTDSSTNHKDARPVVVAAATTTPVSTGRFAVLEDTRTIHHPTTATTTTTSLFPPSGRREVHPSNSHWTGRHPSLTTQKRKPTIPRFPSTIPPPTKSPQGVVPWEEDWVESGVTRTTLWAAQNQVWTHTVRIAEDPSHDVNDTDKTNPNNDENKNKNKNNTVPRGSRTRTKNESPVHPTTGPHKEPYPPTTTNQGSNPLPPKRKNTNKTKTKTRAETSNNHNHDDATSQESLPQRHQTGPPATHSSPHTTQPAVPPETTPTKEVVVGGTTTTATVVAMTHTIATPRFTLFHAPGEPLPPSTTVPPRRRRLGGGGHARALGTLDPSTVAVRRNRPPPYHKDTWDDSGGLLGFTLWAAHYQIWNSTTTTTTVDSSTFHNQCATSQTNASSSESDPSSSAGNRVGGWTRDVTAPTIPKPPPPPNHTPKPTRTTTQNPSPSTPVRPSSGPMVVPKANETSTSSTRAVSTRRFGVLHSPKEHVGVVSHHHHPPTTQPTILLGGRPCDPRHVADAVSSTVFALQESAPLWITHYQHWKTAEPAQEPVQGQRPVLHNDNNTNDTTLSTTSSTASSRLQSRPTPHDSESPLVTAKRKPWPRSKPPSKPLQDDDGDDTPVQSPSEPRCAASTQTVSTTRFGVLHNPLCRNSSVATMKPPEPSSTVQAAAHDQPSVSVSSQIGSDPRTVSSLAHRTVWEESGVTRFALWAAEHQLWNHTVVVVSSSERAAVANKKDKEEVPPEPAKQGSALPVKAASSRPKPEVVVRPTLHQHARPKESPLKKQPKLPPNAARHTARRNPSNMPPSAKVLAALTKVVPTRRFELLHHPREPVPVTTLAADAEPHPATASRSRRTMEVDPCTVADSTKAHMTCLEERGRTNMLLWALDQDIYLSIPTPTTRNETGNLSDAPAESKATTASTLKTIQMANPVQRPPSNHAHNLTATPSISQTQVLPQPSMMAPQERLLAAPTTPPSSQPRQEPSTTTVSTGRFSILHNASFDNTVPKALPSSAALPSFHKQSHGPLSRIRSDPRYVSSEPPVHNRTAWEESGVTRFVLWAAEHQIWNHTVVQTIPKEEKKKKKEIMKQPTKSNQRSLKTQEAPAAKPKSEPKVQSQKETRAVIRTPAHDLKTTISNTTPPPSKVLPSTRIVPSRRFRLLHNPREDVLPVTLPEQNDTPRNGSPALGVDPCTILASAKAQMACLDERGTTCILLWANDNNVDISIPTPARDGGSPYVPTESKSLVSITPTSISTPVAEQSPDSSEQALENTKARPAPPTVNPNPSSKPKVKEPTKTSKREKPHATPATVQRTSRFTVFHDPSISAFGGIDVVPKSRVSVSQSSTKLSADPRSVSALHQQNMILFEESGATRFGLWAASSQMCSNTGATETVQDDEQNDKRRKIERARPSKDHSVDKPISNPSKDTNATQDVEGEAQTSNKDTAKVDKNHNTKLDPKPDGTKTVEDSESVDKTTRIVLPPNPTPSFAKSGTSEMPSLEEEEVEIVFTEGMDDTECDLASVGDLLGSTATVLATPISPSRPSERMTYRDSLASTIPMSVPIASFHSVPHEAPVLVAEEETKKIKTQNAHPKVDAQTGVNENDNTTGPKKVSKDQITEPQNGALDQISSIQTKDRKEGTHDNSKTTNGMAKTPEAVKNSPKEVLEFDELNQTKERIRKVQEKLEELNGVRETNNPVHDSNQKTEIFDAAKIDKPKKDIKEESQITTNEATPKAIPIIVEQKQNHPIVSKTHTTTTETRSLDLSALSLSTDTPNTQMEDEPFTDITVYTATSRIARHALSYLLRSSVYLARPIQITLAGSDETALKALQYRLSETMVNLLAIHNHSNNKKKKKKASRRNHNIRAKMDLFVIQATSDRKHQLETMATRSKVVINCEAAETDLVAVCATNGTDYVDITHDVSTFCVRSSLSLKKRCTVLTEIFVSFNVVLLQVNWVSRMREEYGKASEASGSRIISFCGFDSVPSDMAIWSAVQALRKEVGKSCSVEQACTWFINAPRMDSLHCMPNRLWDCWIGPPIFGCMKDPLVLAPVHVRHDASLAATRKRLAWAEWWNQAIPLQCHSIWRAASGPFWLAVVNAKVVHESARALSYGPDTFVYAERYLPVGQIGSWLRMIWSIMSVICTNVVIVFTILVWKILDPVLLWLRLKKSSDPLPTTKNADAYEKHHKVVEIHAQVQSSSFTPRTKKKRRTRPDKNQVPSKASNGGVVLPQRPSTKASCSMTFTGDATCWITAQCVCEAALCLLLDDKRLPPKSTDGFGTPAQLLGGCLWTRLTTNPIRPVRYKIQIDDMDDLED